MKKSVSILASHVALALLVAQGAWAGGGDTSFEKEEPSAAEKRTVVPAMSVPGERSGQSADEDEGSSEASGATSSDPIGAIMGQLTLILRRFSESQPQAAAAASSQQPLVTQEEIITLKTQVSALETSEALTSEGKKKVPLMKETMDKIQKEYDRVVSNAQKEAQRVVDQAEDWVQKTPRKVGKWLKKNFR